MKHPYRFTATAMLLLATVVVSAQEPKSKTRAAADGREVGNPVDATKAPEIYLFPVSHVSASQLAKTLSEFYKGLGVRISSDDHTNSLIVMPGHVDVQGIKKVVSDFDKPAQRPDQNLLEKMHILQLKNQPDDSFEKALLLITQSDNKQLSIDRNRKQIVFIGREDTLKNVKEFISRWDAATVANPATTGDVQVRVVWIANNVDNEEIALIEDLKPLIPTFKRLGIEKPISPATYMATTQPGTEFSILGDMWALSASLRISGRYDERKSTLSLSIQEAYQEEKHIDLSTEVTAPLGHFVVVGAAKVSGQMAFVVQVTRSEPVPAGKP